MLKNFFPNTKEKKVVAIFILAILIGFIPIAWNYLKNYNSKTV